MKLVQLIRKALIGGKRYKWDSEYASGRWDYFNEPLESSRYEAILYFTGKYLNKGKILEIGCGEGILQARMPRESYSKFLGIDISKVAIRKAARLIDRSTDYRYGDMEKYTPPGTFDVIIFNEVLYYSDDPIRLMARYARYLEPQGLVISSCFQTANSLQIMQDVEKHYKVVDQKISVNERGAWHCKVYSDTRPGASFPYAP